MQRAMQMLQRLPPSWQAPVMNAAMAAMQDPGAAKKSALLMLLPVNVSLLFFPHIVKIALVAFSVLKGRGSYDNVHSRGESQAENMSKYHFRDWIFRAQSAHRNSLESFPIFATGVLALVSVGKVSTKNIKLALRYTLFRVLYIILYIVGTSQIPAALRSVCYIDNMLTCTWLLQAAARSAWPSGA